jgi:hypothetical protein
MFMKRITSSIPLFVALIGLSILSTNFGVNFTYAADAVKAKTTVTTTAPTSTTTVKEEPVSTTDESTIDTTVAKEKAKGIWAVIKAWGISVYEKINAWRLSQATIWRDIKSEKELQITSLSQTTEENRNERVENTLNGEQGTLFKGSSQDFKGTGNVFLLKLYVFALNIFLFIFTTPVIFYGIIIIGILSILNRIVQKIRNPHGF